MSKSIETQALNSINIVGKLIDATFGEGTMSDGRYYERATLTIRVNQKVEGKEETSDIPVSIFAAKYTKQQKANPAFESLQGLKQFKTAQNIGIDAADTVHIRGANIRENNFVSRSGNLVNGWQLNASFVNKGNGSDIASFNVDIYIMDMHEEVNREGDTTGRLVIRGGVVQWGGKLDVLEFVVEDPDKVDYLQRNWNVNDTVKASGRIRVTAVEEKRPSNTSSWGEELPEETTRTVRELVITGGSDEGYEEEFAYDGTEIKKAFNVRKALIEQMQLDAKKNNSGAKAAPAAKSGGKYDWE